MIESLSVVVPVYNSAGILPELIRRLAAVLPVVARQYEVVLVNDGSADDSARVARDVSVAFGWVRRIDLTKNFGQHSALLCGIRAARHRVIVTIDDDLQHPPEEIPKLLHRLVGAVQVVYGTPERAHHDSWRDTSSKVTKFLLQRLLRVSGAQSVSAFRAFRTELRDAFAFYQGPHVNIDVMLTWSAGHFASVPVAHARRAAGRSNYTFRTLMRHALNMTAGFSTTPLRLASLVGFFFTAFGCAVFVYAVGRYVLFGSSVPGFTFLASAIAIFSGAQLFALGILGEYVGHIFQRSLQMPSYQVKTDSSHPAQPADVAST